MEILIILCNHGIVKTMMNVEELQQQLQEKKVTIGILGRHSMGKTTLINALLHGRYITLCSPLLLYIKLLMLCKAIHYVGIDGAASLYAMPNIVLYLFH